MFIIWGHRKEISKMKTKGWNVLGTLLKNFWKYIKKLRSLIYFLVIDKSKKQLEDRLRSGRQWRHHRERKGASSPSVPLTGTFGVLGGSEQRKSHKVSLVVLKGFKESQEAENLNGHAQTARNLFRAWRSAELPYNQSTDFKLGVEVRSVLLSWQELRSYWGRLQRTEQRTSTKRRSHTQMWWPFLWRGIRRNRYI